MSLDETSDATLTDAILVVRCQLGDESAWRALVEQWHPRLWRFVLRMLSDQTAAEDVLQTVWLRVVRSLIRLRDPDRLAAWIYRIARLAVADQLRHQYRQPLTVKIEDVTQVNLCLTAFQVGEEIEHGLRELHVADREVVVLFYLEQLSVAEVAGICELPEGTVKSRLNRARFQMRDTLEKKEPKHEKRN
jgi:RNA polymerase sigma factor (sigma-70 family)